jgi:hypothetical protein
MHRAGCTPFAIPHLNKNIKPLRTADRDNHRREQRFNNNEFSACTQQVFDPYQRALADLFSVSDVIKKRRPQAHRRELQVEIKKTVDLPNIHFWCGTSPFSLYAQGSLFAVALGEEVYFSASAGDNILTPCPYSVQAGSSLKALDFLGSDLMFICTERIGVVDLFRQEMFDTGISLAGAQAACFQTDDENSLVWFGTETGHLWSQDRRHPTALYQATHGSNCWNLKLSPDRTKVAVSGHEGLSVFDTRYFEKNPRKFMNGRVSSMSWASRDRLYFGGSMLGLYDTSFNKVVCQYDGAGNGLAAVTDMVLLDDTRLLTSHFGGPMRSWNTRRGDLPGFQLDSVSVDLNLYHMIRLSDTLLFGSREEQEDGLLFEVPSKPKPARPQTKFEFRMR